MPGHAREGMAGAVVYFCAATKYSTGWVGLLPQGDGHAAGECRVVFEMFETLTKTSTYWPCAS
jgi:hypothetical protein